MKLQEHETILTKQLEELARYADARAEAALAHRDGSTDPIKRRVHEGRAGAFREMAREIREKKP